MFYSSTADGNCTEERINNEAVLCELPEFSYFIRTVIIAVAAPITDAIPDINAINQNLFPIS